MRNLKKVLALVLALVMSMSLVTIANAADFSDSADINYKEAVDVMTAIGVIDGLDTGAFNPTGTLTREQAAKIICTMMLGSGADKLGTTSSSFSDVASTRWSSPYIEYCASIGIIAGNGDGTFNPTGKLTGHAFAKMLLGALGYDSAYEGYTGAGWSVEVAKDAVVAGITLDGVAMSAQLTREQATQMAFQTLTADTVQYATAGTSVILPDGTQIVTSGSTASKVDAAKKGDNYVGYEAKAEDNDEYVQFCETYFDKLVKADAKSGDDFGRPAIVWSYDGDDIGTYADEADEVVYVTDDGKDIEYILTDSDYMNYKKADISEKATYAINGDDTADAQDRVQVGDIVEVYEDDGEVVTVVVRRYSAAIIDEIDEDLSNSEIRDGASVELTLTEMDGTEIDSYYDAYDDADAALTGYNSAYKEGAVLAVAFEDATVGGKVLDSYVADSVTGSVSGYRTGETVTLDGTKYPVAYAAQADATGFDFDEDYTLYLTAEGFIIGIEGATGVTLDDVYYVTGVYSKAGTYGGNDYYAQAVSLADGTVEEIKLDVDESNNAGDLTGLKGDVNFTVDQAGLYTFDDGKAAEYDDNEDYIVRESKLTDDATVSATRIDTAAGRFYLDDTTKYLAVDENASDIKVTTATGGMRASTGDTIYVIADNRDAVYVLYIDAGASTAAADVVYVADASYDTVGKDSYEGEVYYAETGKAETIVVDKAYGEGFYTIDGEDDGVYSLKALADEAGTKVDSNFEGALSNIIISNPDNIYRGALTGTNSGKTFDDVAITGKIIDARDNIDREINSISRLESAVEDGGVTVDLYVTDGEITFICVIETDSTGIAAAVDAVLSSDSFNNYGSFSVSGNQVTVTGNASYIELQPENEGRVTKISADLAQFLGALYRTSDAKAIVYEGTTYSWNPSEAGDLAGSNWYGNNETLVKAITDDWKDLKSDGAGWQTGVTYKANLTVDGTAMTYTAIVG